MIQAIESNGKIFWKSVYLGKASKYQDFFLKKKEVYDVYIEGKLLRTSSFLNSEVNMNDHGVKNIKPRLIYRMWKCYTQINMIKMWQLKKISLKFI